MNSFFILNSSLLPLQAFELEKNVILLKEADNRFAPFQFNSPLCLPKFSQKMTNVERDFVIEQIQKKNPHWGREEVERRLNECISSRETAIKGFAECAGLFFCFLFFLF